jgi:hypothetical protein
MCQQTALLQAEMLPKTNKQRSISKCLVLLEYVSKLIIISVMLVKNVIMYEIQYG